MEDDAVVEPLAREGGEVLDGLGRLGRVELDLDRAVIRVDGCVCHRRPAYPAVRRRDDSYGVSEQRTVRFSVRSVLTVIGLVVATWALLTMVAIARHVIVWILVSIFLALALNPAVEWFMRRGVKSRGLAAGATRTSSRSS